MGWKPQHNRAKTKYNATPTAREKAYHLWLIDRFDCACGCDAVSGVVHHPLTRHADQRWRRDHEFVVPMHGFCHMRLHQIGHERDAPFTGLEHEAAYLRTLAYAEGIL